MATAIPSSRNTIYQEDVAYKRALSEAILSKIGATINFIIDRIIFKERIEFKGYFSASSFDEDMTSIFVPTKCEVVAWAMTVNLIRTTGNNSANIQVYDETGALVGNLFSTAPIINNSATTHAVIGKTIDGTTVAKNNSGYTLGVFNFTTLEKGWTLRPFIVSNSTRAFGLILDLTLAPQE